MKKILITGGCGYIGSHTIVDLIESGYEIVSIDNFSNSYPDVLDNIFEITGKKITNFDIDLCTLEAVETVFKKHSDIAGIIHFAALKAVGESVDEPLKYYKNNILSLLNILECCKKYKVTNFVFSSSCSVYGNAKKLPVDESTPLVVSESPYAETKVMAERIITDFATTTAFKTTLLRYFNPIGAHKSGIIGEKSKSEPLNLIPRITGTVLGKYQDFKVFGTDYNTRDGSCIRDYIHVSDIAHGHTLAIEWLLKQENNTLEVFNMGSGNGVSVLEMIAAFEQGTSQKLNYSLQEKRAGDVVAIYANNDKAKKHLNWLPKQNLETMMVSAWEWAKKQAT